MAPFIAIMIMKSREKSLEEGQTNYRAYFINTKLYVRFQADVDTILETEGKADCIVTE